MRVFKIPGLLLELPVQFQVTQDLEDRRSAHDGRTGEPAGHRVLGREGVSTPMRRERRWGEGVSVIPTS